MRSRLGAVFSDKRYALQLSKVKDNWLELPAEMVLNGVLSELERIEDQVGE